MTTKFNPGDTVKRVSWLAPELGEYCAGKPFVIHAVTRTGLVCDPDGGMHSDEYLELVDTPPLPVRKVTRTEVVDGTYGQVFVRNIPYRELSLKPYVAVALVSYGESGDVDTPLFQIHAAELRDAAAVFLSLAEALEEQP